MSSLHDPLKNPFDLIKTGQEMDNVVPFLAPNKVNQMIDAALAQPQLAVKKQNSVTAWKFGGLAIAASLAVFMVFLSPAQTPVLNTQPQPVAQAATSEDANEFAELVILENWERF